MRCYNVLAHEISFLSCNLYRFIVPFSLKKQKNKKKPKNNPQQKKKVVLGEF